MHRNTYLLVSLLAVIAALVLGVNIGRQFQKSENAQILPSKTPSIDPRVSPGATPSTIKSYKNPFCKIAFDYPSELTILESASGSAAFTGPNEGDGILLICQKDIARPSIAGDTIEDIRIGSVAAKLYHTQSEKDGTLIDSLIFRHPVTRLDVFLAGTKVVLQRLISSIIILP